MKDSVLLLLIWWLTIWLFYLASYFEFTWIEEMRWHFPTQMILLLLIVFGILFGMILLFDVLENGVKTDRDYPYWPGA